MAVEKNRKAGQQRVTMAGIAAEAGCSLMTVSRALRADPRVSAQMRQRVLDCASRLGYRPDPEISRLMSRLHVSRVAESEAIAWVTTGSAQNDWRSNHSAVAIFDGAVARAAALGYRLEVFWSGDCGHCGRRLSQVLRHRGIRAVLVAPLVGHGSGVFTDFDWQPFVSVGCGFSLAAPRLHRACSQQHQAVSLAWEQLWQRGYRRIGLALSRDSSRRTGNMWLSGYLACQSEMLANDATAVAVPPLWLEPEGAQAFADWLREHGVQAVIGTGEVFSFAEVTGLEIPKDFAFAALNTIDMPEHVCGVDHHMDALGAAAIELISEQLRLHCYGLPAIPRNLMVECDWTDGLSAPAVWAAWTK